MITFCVGALLKYASLVLASLGARAALAQTCPGSWSPPFDLAYRGRPVYVESGVVTSLGPRTLLIGAPTFFWMTPDRLVPYDWKPGEPIDTAAVRLALTSVGAVADAKRVTDAVPPVDTLTLRSQPRLIGWTPGRVDIAWRASVPMLPSNAVDSSGRRNEPKYDRVEHATFDGVRWSRPEVIVRGRVSHIVGPPAVRAGVTFDEGAFAIAPETTTVGEIRVGIRRADRWITATWRDSARFFIEDPIAFRSKDGGIALVYRANDRDGKQMLSTHVERWIGDSAVWSSPVVAAVLGPSGGYMTPTAAHLGRDSIIVGWHQSDAGVVSAFSPDAGRTWKVVPVVAGVTAEGLHFVVDGRGVLHALYRASDPGILGSPGAIMETTFRNGAWTPPSLVSRSSEASPSAGAIANGSLLLLGGSIVGAAGPQPKSWAQTWSPSCRE